jgi:hypothetical protein
MQAILDERARRVMQISGSSVIVELFGPPSRRGGPIYLPPRADARTDRSLQPSDGGATRRPRGECCN